MTELRDRIVEIVDAVKADDRARDTDEYVDRIMRAVETGGKPPTHTMRCADEDGWPEREFELIPRSNGTYACAECGWNQSSFEDGVRELVLSAEWNGIPALIKYLGVIEDASLELQGEISVDVIR